MFTTDLVNLYNRKILKTSLYIYIFQDEKCRLMRNLSLSMYKSCSYSYHRCVQSYSAMSEQCLRTQNLVLLLLPQQICKELLYNERRLRSQDPGSPSSCPVCVLSILDVLEVLVALYLGCPC